MVPVAVPGEPGLFTVDGTWGTITPFTLDGGVVTVGELEVIEQGDDIPARYLLRGCDGRRA